VARTPEQPNDKRLESDLRPALPLSGQGKNVTRRRFFEAALAASVAAFFTPPRAQAAEVNCQTMQNICSGSNSCDPNTCAVINVCTGTNTCTAPDVCSGRNTCITENRHNNCGGCGNRCKVNFCIKSNVCATNTCEQNVCQVSNTCQVANNCNPNTCTPSGNSCGAGNECNSADRTAPLPRPTLADGESFLPEEQQVIEADASTLMTMRRLRRGFFGDPYGFKA